MLNTQYPIPNTQSKANGFTLIELIIVISIIGIMAGLLLPNFMASRTRARDSAKKADLRSVKQALQMYNGDKNIYPAAGAANLDIVGCGATGATACNMRSNPTPAFQAGSTVFMKKFPSITFYYYTNGTFNDFVLRTTLENPSDDELTVSHSRCQTSCTATGSVCCSNSLDYCLCPD
ncbi:hypothetical protein A3B57_02605 [Microgenomates group bacterium RIFCSPLOWO2_01_FULL_47_10]|nr:MAG: hypothetical protein A3B57_02605 [Microgenomates group bacterium RIFCSPLOWO2_01_FULL_47_10]